MTPDQEALKGLVDEVKEGGKRPLAPEEAETILDWADEANYPRRRASPGDVADPSNWKGHPERLPHVHLPGAGRGGHIPVQSGVRPRTRIGFVVLRKPQLLVASTCDSRLAASSYCGVDREPWCDLREAHYAGVLPANLETIHRNLLDENRDLAGLLITKNIDNALAAIRYFHNDIEKDEICVISSNYLRIIKG
jgi:hypothetical protein